MQYHLQRTIGKWSRGHIRMSISVQKAQKDFFFKVFIIFLLKDPVEFADWMYLYHWQHISSTVPAMHITHYTLVFNYLFLFSQLFLLLLPHLLHKPSKAFCLSCLILFPSLLCLWILSAITFYKLSCLSISLTLLSFSSLEGLSPPLGSGARHSIFPTLSCSEEAGTLALLCWHIDPPFMPYRIDIVCEYLSICVFCASLST